jgi:hypothetical protein
MYCVKFYDPLRSKFGLFKEGDEENEGFRSGRGQSLCFLFCLESSSLLRESTAGEVSTSAFARLRRGGQRSGYNIYETASNQNRHAYERGG